MAIETLYPAIRPSLNLDFANAKALDPRISFSRASAATYYDGKTVANAEENLLLRSQEFTSTAWTKLGASIAQVNLVAPDATATASSLTEDSSNAQHYFTQSCTTSAGLPYTFSIYCKAGGRNFGAIYLSVSTFPVGATVFFDLSSGVITSTGAGVSASSIQGVGNGWFRVSISAVGTASGTGIAAVYLSNSASSTAAYQGDGSSGIYIWGAQLEQRSQVTAYTPTTTQPITNYIPVLQTAPAGVPRFDHNPVTGESLGLLVEEQRTNVLTYSEQFDNAFWLKTNALIGQNFVLAPDGTLTGDKLIENSVNGQHAVSGNVNAVAGTYTLSVYLKAAERTWAAVGIYDVGAGTSYRTFFNLYSGAVGTNAAGNTATITPVGNGWFRCSVSRAITGSGTNSCSIFVSNADGVLSYQGDGYSGIYIWGAQLEAGAFPTSYIKTEASQVTRAADSASMVGANFSSWYRQDEGVLLFHSRRPLLSAGAIQVSDGTTSNRMIVAGDASNLDRGYVMVNGATDSTIPVSSNTGGFDKKALAYRFNDIAYAKNGSAPGIDTASRVPVVNQLSVPTLTASFHIQKFSYYPKRLTDAQLQALTA